MRDIIVKNTNKRGETTITIKVDLETKKQWEKFCVNNDINQSATLKNIIKKLIEGGAL